MLKWYGYLGLLLIAFAELNFYFKIMPFAEWYIPIVWYGFLFFVDSIVFRVAKRSLMSSHTKEFVFMLLLSVPFWLIFEFYNLFTVSWIYINYTWYVHIIDFTIIMPAILEVFTLMNALGVAEEIDSKVRKSASGTKNLWPVALLVPLGALASLMPILAPSIGFPFMWFGLFLLIDPFNFITNRPSILQKAAMGKKSIIAKLFISGIIVGFFWEFWNFQAYPMWVYNLPYWFLPNFKLFEMPLLGYIGYLPFSLEVYAFYALFRSSVFKRKNDLLSM